MESRSKVRGVIRMWVACGRDSARASGPAAGKGAAYNSVHLSVPHDDQVQALLPGLGAEPERPAGGGRRKRRGTAEPRPRAGGSPREGRHEHFRQAIWREGVSNLHPLAAGMQRMLRLVRTGATWGCGGCGCGRRSMSTQIPSIWQQSAPLQKVAVPVPCPHFVPSHLRPTGRADALLCVRATVL